VSYSLGIDLGTNFCRTACQVGGRLEVIPSSDEQPGMPAYLAAGEDGRVVVGRRAVPSRYDPASHPISRLKGHLSGATGVWFAGALHPPAQVATFLFQQLRANAERMLRGPIGGAVVAVPALAGNLQRVATVQAAEQAAFKPVRLLNEPTAAAMGHTAGAGGDRLILVYALGAGYFETAVIRSAGKAFDALAVQGDSEIGGNAFDRQIAQQLLAKILERYGVDLSTDVAFQWLLERQVEVAKKRLDRETETTIHLPRVARRRNGEWLHLELEFGRANLEAALRAAIEKTVRLAQETVTEAHLTLADIDEVLMVGGSTRMPLVAACLYEAFGRQPVAGSDDLIACGAAVLAVALGGAPDVSAQSAGQKTVPVGQHPAPEVPRGWTPGEGAAELLPSWTPGMPPAGAGGQQTGATSALALLDDAWALIQENRPTEALARLDALRPADVQEAHATRQVAARFAVVGLRLGEAGQISEGVRALEKALAYDESSPDIRGYLTKTYEAAALHAMNQGKADEAIRMIDRSRAHGVFGAWAGPLLAEAHKVTGVQRANKGQWKEALAAFEIALRHRPGDPAVREYVVRSSLRRAEQLRSEHRLPQARAVLTRAAELVPGDERLLLGPAQGARRGGEKPRKRQKGRHKR
jgi:actin-like ATPase involved in cell morphogenesis